MLGLAQQINSFLLCPFQLLIFPFEGPITSHSQEQWLISLPPWLCEFTELRSPVLCSDTHQLPSHPVLVFPVDSGPTLFDSGNKTARKQERDWVPFICTSENKAAKVENCTARLFFLKFATQNQWPHLNNSLLQALVQPYLIYRLVIVRLAK